MPTLPHVLLMIEVLRLEAVEVGLHVWADRLGDVSDVIAAGLDPAAITKVKTDAQIELIVEVENLRS